MADTLTELIEEHSSRQLQRLKTRAPLTLVTLVIVLGSIVACGFLIYRGRVSAGIAAGVCGIALGVLWTLSAQLLAEWDRAVVLRLGHFRGARGPGFFMILPLVDRVVRVVDMRVRTTAFHSEAMLTKDTVPVEVNSIAFWHVWDPQKAVLEVESYYQAIVRAVQTALRDIVGVHSLAELLAEREQTSAKLQKIMEEKAQAWGISVATIEIRDIAIPETLKDALSKQAQAERESQSRAILGQAEEEIARKFAEASKEYQNNPVALQLRAMNILYEGLRHGSSMVLVPSSVLDTMNLGGVIGLAQGQMPRTPPPAAMAD